MSDHIVDMRDGATVGAGKLLARAAAAESRARRRHAGIADDFFLPDDIRLDERTRAALDHLLRALVQAVETPLRTHGAKALTTRHEHALAETLEASPGVYARLVRSGVLHDPDLMVELLARVRQEQIAALVPAQTSDEPERGSLLTRFSQHPDRRLADQAHAVLVAESRRRAEFDQAERQGTDLPAELHHRLVWWAAAALRELNATAAGESLPHLDLALCEAAKLALTTHDEGERLEAASLRFASAIDPQPDELADLAIEALGDRRITLFVALLAHALGVAYDAMRDIVFDPDSDRLWLVLRALDMDRTTIARIGHALCEADPRRDLEVFADMIDAIVAIDAGVARSSMAPLRLPADYRAAMQAIERGGRPS
jgi:hypothetical protein